MPLCRRRGGGREDESGLVVEGEEGENREEMEEEIRPTGQMDTIRSLIQKNSDFYLLFSDHIDILARSMKAWTMTPTTTLSSLMRCVTRVTSLSSSRCVLPIPMLQ